MTKGFPKYNSEFHKSSYSMGGENQEHRPCLKGPSRHTPAVLVTEFLIDAHYFPWYFLFIFLLAPRKGTPSGIIPLPQSQHYPSSFLGPFLSFILPKGMMLVCYRRTHLITQVPVKILYRPVFLLTVFVLLGASFLTMSHFLEFCIHTLSREYFQQNWSRLFFCIKLYECV